jgi:hypothetical protein
MKAARVFVPASLALGAFFFVSFFAQVRSTLSEATGPSFSCSIQQFSNFLDKRPFQISIFATDQEMASVGASHNPYGYLHSNAIHVNFVPYVFVPLWALHPTPAFLHLLIVLWNAAGLGVFGWLAVRRFAPREQQERALFALAVLAAGGSLAVFTQKAQPLLFAGPFFAAAYYYARAGNNALYLLSLLGLSLVQEDAAVAAVALSVTLGFVVPGRRKPAAAGAALGLAIALYMLLVMQPSARLSLANTDATTTAVYVKKLGHLDLGIVLAALKGSVTLLPWFAAIFAAALLFGVPGAPAWLRIAALAFVAPAPHWVVSLTSGPGHHLLPPLAGLYLALLELLISAPGGAAQGRAAAAALALFTALGVRVQASFLPLSLRRALLTATGQQAKLRALDAAEAQIASNRAVLAAAAAIPREASLVYWVNAPLTGLVAGRPDVWRFPDYWDRADYLLMQKDAQDLFFDFDPGPDLAKAIAAGRIFVWRRPMTAGMLEPLVKDLVKTRKLYAVDREDEHVVLLKRLKSEKLENPPETYGWRWR